MISKRPSTHRNASEKCMSNPSERTPHPSGRAEEGGRQQQAFLGMGSDQNVLMLLVKFTPGTTTFEQPSISY